MFERILMPIDGSDCSREAVRQGLDFAGKLGSQVTFLYVVEDPFTYVPNGMVAYTEVYEDIRRAGEELLAEVQQLATERGVRAQTSLVTGALASPVDAIIEAAEKHDLIVMGTHGRRGFDRWFLGSVTEGVIRRSSTPHLIFRCTGGAAPENAGEAQR